MLEIEEIMIRSGSVWRADKIDVMGKVDKVVHITIMYRDSPVISIDRRSASFKILDKRYLPFELRNKDLNYDNIIRWLEHRVRHLNRDYMKKISQN